MLQCLYERYRAQSVEQIADIAEHFAAPLLVQPPEGWENARHRVVYVGQETRGWSWSTEDAQLSGYVWPYDQINNFSDFLACPFGVTALMHGYTQFNFAALRPQNYNSAFWRYFRCVQRRFQVAGQTASVLSTNVVRCAVDADNQHQLQGVQIEICNRYLTWQAGLLRAELRILKPTLVLFVTGPNYDEYLRIEFDNLEFHDVGNWNPHTFARLQSPSLDVPAFRTYHPSFLNWNPAQLGFLPLEEAISTVL